MSSYPPGVSGNEFPITGWLKEWVGNYDCPSCPCEDVDCMWHPDQGAWATCPECGEVWELPDPREDPDPEWRIE